MRPRGVGVVHPGWSPDGRQIVFFRSGDKDCGGPDPVAKDAVFVIDADGQNLHRISAPSMPAQFAEWSPDGARIVFVSAERSASRTSTRCGRTGPTCVG